MTKGSLKQKYLEFRRDNITRVVAAVSEQVRKTRPKVKISAAVFSNWAVDRDKVGDFLKHFESIALVRRRKGRDLLAAPAGCLPAVHQQPGRTATGQQDGEHHQAHQGAAQTVLGLVFHVRHGKPGSDGV